MNYYNSVRSEKSVFRFILILTLFSLVFAGNLFAASFKLEKTAPDTVKTGDKFIYTIRYTCQSTTEDCSNAVITDVIDDNLEIVKVYKTDDVQSKSISGQTVTWTMVDPLPAGATGEVKVKVKVKEGVTENALDIPNSAVPSQNGTDETPAEVNVTTEAAPHWYPQKELVPEDGDHTGEVYPDRNATYRVSLCSPSGDNIGGLNLNGTTFVDTLPEGATFVSATGGGIYDSGSGTVTWDMGDLNVTNDVHCYSQTLVVNYPSSDPSNTENTTKTNTLDVSGTLPGGTPATYDDEVSNPMKKYVFVPHVTPGFEKYGIENGTGEDWFRDDTVGDDHNFTYSIRPTNDGNVNLTNYYFIDDINDAEVTLLGVTTGVYNESGTVTVEYKKTGDTAWHLMGSSSQDTSTSFSAANGDFNATDGSDEVTEIRMSYSGDINGNIVPGFRPTAMPTLLVKLDHPGTYDEGDSIENNATLHADDNESNPLTEIPAEALINVRDNYSVPRVTKSNDTNGEDMAPGDTVTYTLKVENSSEGTGTLVDPVITDLLPKGFIYNNDAVWTDVNSGVTGQPSCTAVDDFNSSGRTLLRCVYNGNFPRGTYGNLAFSVLIDNTAGFGPIENKAHATTNDTSNPHECGTSTAVVDSADEDNDGNTTEMLCESENTVSVLDTANIAAFKWVKGELDADYTRYPDTGKTLGGGAADYKLIITNNGNVAVKDIEVLDILPFIGDTGVTNTDDNRDTEWRPNLAGEITVPNAIVFYSLAGNPCRAADGYVSADTPDCQAPDWSTTAPGDISQVRAVKIVFDSSVVLEPNQTMEFNWEMIAPVGSPSGLIAWNSFAFKGDRIDGAALLPAEPLKVGIEVQEDTNNSYGDYVWLDLNQNGIQDDNETGINGVKVNLYKDGDTTTPYATIVTTTTAYDGRMGTYNFVNLPDGDYIAEFILPEGYTFSPQDNTGDTLDSDADPFTGRTAAVTLSGGTHTVDWDAGIYPDPTATPGVAALGNYVWYDNNYNDIQDAGDTPVEGMVVKLLDENGTHIDTTTTSSLGEYLFSSLAPGDYYVEFVPPYEYILSDKDVGGDDNIDSDANVTTHRTDKITLAAGDMDLTHDAGIYHPAAMGDRVWHDRDADGRQDGGEPGIPGVTVTLVRESDSKTYTTVTDGSGSYHFDDLHPGAYHVVFDYSTSTFAQNADHAVHVTRKDATDDAHDSDVDPVTLTTGTFTLNELDDNLTLDMGLYIPASLGDKVWVDDNGDGTQQSNAQEAAVPNVQVWLYDGNGDLVTVDANGTIFGTDGSLDTNASGEYLFDNLVPGVYHVEFNKTTLPPEYVFTTKGGGNGTPDAADSDADRTTGATANTTLSSDEDDMSWDAGIYIPASIGDYTWHDYNGDGIQDSSEENLSNVQVNLYLAGCTTAVTQDQNGTAIGTITTDATGYYLFDNLKPDTYCVKFTAPNGYVITQKDASGSSDQNDSDAVPSTGNADGYILTSDEDNVSVDAGFYEPVKVGDRVWVDRDYNGVQDAGEQNLSGVEVELYRDGTQTGTTTQTDSNGLYLFDGLPAGHIYSVKFTPPNGYQFTQQDKGGDDALDSDANVTTGMVISTPIMYSGDSNLTLDAGVYEPVTIGDYVWEDTNANGIQENGEPGISNVNVTLVIDGTPTATTTLTDGSGHYQFTGLLPNHNYSVEFTAPTDYYFTPQNVGDDSTDSDANAAGTGVAATPTMYSGEQNQTLDAGLYRKAALGNRVWIDENGNGVQDNGEAGIDGVTATLFNGSGQQGSVTTSGGGLYHFTDLVPGSYYVVFSNLPANYVFTGQNEGAEGIDSDANATTGISDVVTLASGEDNNDTDAGIYIPVEVGDRIWVDTNANGIQDAGEPNYDGEITVKLIDNNDSANTYTVTTNTGYYNISNVRPGNYHIEFTLPAGFNVSPANQGGDDSIDSDVVGLSTGNFDLVSGVNQYTWDMGIYQLASIGDRIWFDLNGDGVQDAGESNVAEDVTVTLLDENNQTVDTQTVANGSYQFTDLIPGEYHLRFEIPSNYVVSPQDANSTTDDLDSDVNTIAVGPNQYETEPTMLISGENDPDWDAGIYIPATIGNLVWLDSNANGIQDAGEGGIPNVNITLFKKEDNGSVTNIGTQATGSDGNYTFTALVPGDYYLTGEVPAGYEISPLDAGNNDSLDSDLNASSGQTAVTTLEGGENDMSWDIGLYQLATIGDQVWIDTNGNGIQDDGETLDTNVTVNLYYDDNDSLADTMTVSADSDGEYLFTDLVPTRYYVEFIPEAGSGYLFTVADRGGDDALDSDVNRTTGRTPVEEIVSAEDNRTLDAGIYRPASLGDRVWLDANADGIQDPGEGNVSDINVTLYDSTGAVAGLTVTDENGSYRFDGLLPGDYTVAFALTDNDGQDYVVTPKTGSQDDTDNSDVNATGVTDTVTLVSGENNPNIDAGLYIPVTIGDYVWSDFDRDGAQDQSESPIANVHVELYKEGNATVQAQTDTNATGGYLFEDIAPGNYYVVFAQPAHFRPTVKDSSTATDANDSDADAGGYTDVFAVVSPEDNLTIDAGFYELAQISGNVSEDTNNDDLGDTMLEGVIITLMDSNGTQISQTTTDSSGNYAFIDVEPGTYTVVETQPNGMVSVSENEGGADNDPGNTTLDNIIAVIVGVGEVDVNNDFVEELGVDIGDRIWMDENGDGIQDNSEDNTTVLEDISVNLYRDGTYVSTTTTDANGYYLFENYPDGNYSVEFNLTTLPEHYGVTKQDQGSDDELDSDVNATTFDTINDETAMTIEDTLVPGEQNLTFDMGIYRLGTISGTIRVDMDGDNDVNGPNDDVMAGVQLDLLDENGNVVATTTTDVYGHYKFIDVPEGQYTIREHQPDGYLDINATDGDILNDDINEITVIVGPGEDDTNNDFNEKLGGKIGDYVWNDTDVENGANGIQDPDESGVNGVHVCLEDANGDPVLDSLTGEQRCTDTNATGYYEFVGLIPGTYVVVFEIPNGTDLTPEPQAGDDETVDSNPLETEEENGTIVAKAPIDVSIGEQNETIDMGLVYIGTAAIGDYVWQDKNRDGIQNPNEPGLDGVHVILYDESGTKLEEYVTHNDGFYRFEHLYAGHYTVEFILPQDWLFTDNNAGEDTGDSDADPRTGRTVEIDLLEGQYQRVWDAGVYCSCEEAANSGDSGDAMNVAGMLLMILLTGLTGFYFLRREEEYQI